jgi:hypothetical protein
MEQLFAEPAAPDGASSTSDSGGSSSDEEPYEQEEVEDLGPQSESEPETEPEYDAEPEQAAAPSRRRNRRKSRLTVKDLYEARTELVSPALLPGALQQASVLLTCIAIEACACFQGFLFLRRLAG